jgi:nicotinamide riboside transporter PnuC
VIGDTKRRSWYYPVLILIPIVLAVGQAMNGIYIDILRKYPFIDSIMMIGGILASIPLAKKLTSLNFAYVEHVKKDLNIGVKDIKMDIIKIGIKQFIVQIAIILTMVLISVSCLFVFYISKNSDINLLAFLCGIFLSSIVEMLFMYIRPIEKYKFYIKHKQRV